jgi:hypothetical protein
MSDKKILEESVVNFFSGKKEYRSLSNFWENDVVIVINDTVRTYESGEHCFHGEKYFRIGEHCKDEKRRESLISHGMKFIKPSLYKNCAEAKKMGGKKVLHSLWKRLCYGIISAKWCKKKYAIISSGYMNK